MHAAFDMTYGWELHHLLNEIAQGKKTTAQLDEYFAKAATASYGRGAYRMYFTSNHDENSWQGSEFERMGANHVPAFVLSATAQSSMPLLYTGQEVSMRKRLRFFEKDTVDWNGPSLAPFYRAVFDAQARAAGAGERAVGRRAGDAQDGRRRSCVCLHAHARREHGAGRGQLRRHAGVGELLGPVGGRRATRTGSRRRR